MIMPGTEDWREREKKKKRRRHTKERAYSLQMRPTIIFTMAELEEQLFMAKWHYPFLDGEGPGRTGAQLRI